jgi:hypothetical protein
MKPNDSRFHALLVRTVVRISALLSALAAGSLDHGKTAD